MHRYVTFLRLYFRPVEQNPDRKRGNFLSQHRPCCSSHFLTSFLARQVIKLVLPVLTPPQALLVTGVIGMQRETSGQPNKALGGS